MDESVRERLAILERQVAILRGKPDPGLPCPGVNSDKCHSKCYGGSIKVYDNSLDWGWSKCPTCHGTMRVYPPED